MDKGKIKRKAVRLARYDYSAPGAYFITICTKNRQNYFWNGLPDSQVFSWVVVGANCVRPRNLPLSPLGMLVLEELERWSVVYPAVRLQSYVIMPDHLHIMVLIEADECGRPQVAPTVSRMVKQFKGAVTKKAGKSLWQKSFMEHVIRNREDFDVRANYLYNNPFHRSK